MTEIKSANSKFTFKERWSRSFLNPDAWKAANKKEKYRLLTKLVTTSLVLFSIAFLIQVIMVWTTLSPEGNGRYVFYNWHLGNKIIQIPVDDIDGSNLGATQPKLVKDGAGVVMGISGLLSIGTFLIATAIHNKGLTWIGIGTLYVFSLAIIIGFGGIFGFLLGIIILAVAITYTILKYKNIFKEESEEHLDQGFYKYFGQTISSRRGNL